MDTTLRDCIICGEEGDCIEGICSECAAKRDKDIEELYSSAKAALNSQIIINNNLQAENKRLKDRIRIVIADCETAETVNGRGWWTKAKILLKNALKE